MKKKSFVWLPVICALFTACSSPLLEWIEAESGTTLYASGKGITAFSFSIPGETDTIGTTPSGGITPITVVLPSGTSIPTYSPTIEYIGKSVGLAPGELENFTGPVKYRVTAA
ncbi:MAG: hypothetical protein LBE02_03560, partial [Spirochaetaceae bacterium]|nr:hypothetical protein [Spirochaetaceae bacterium]